MTVIELSGLLIVVIAVSMMVGGGRGDVGRVTQFPDGATPALAILGGAIVAYYSFVGFETSANVAEEIRNPSKVYPAALFGALITAGVLYALVGVASARRCRRRSCPSRRVPCCRWSLLLESACRTGCSAPSRWWPSPTALCSP